MIERRYYSPSPELERRSAWRWKRVVYPVVAAILALLMMFSRSGATHEETEAGQSATVVMRDGSLADCWYDRGPLERFCNKHTLERR